MLHLVLPPLCASCYSHHYSQVAQTQQPAHHWTRMAKEKKKNWALSCKQVKKQAPMWGCCRIISFPSPDSVSAFSFFCVFSLFFLLWLIRCSRESSFYDITHRKKKSSTGALTGAYIEQIVSYFWSSQCCRWLDTGNMLQPRSVLIYSWNWFQPPPLFVEAALVRMP